MGRRAALAVELVEEIVHQDEHKTLHRWTITTGTGYRAVIPECSCGLIRVLGVRYADANRTKVAETYTTPVKNCTCRSEECRRRQAGARGVHLCHGWHRARVDAMVVELVRTARRGYRVARVGAGVGAPAFRDGYGPGDRVTYRDTVTGDAPAERRGLIWADGPEPSTIWVQPDHDPFGQVAVKLPSPVRAKRGDGPETLAGYPATWQRDTVRRCENLRQRGALYRTRRRTGHYGSTDVIEFVTHADPDCPSAAGLDREPSPYTVREVLAVLYARRQWWTAKLCARCIYLDESAEIGAAV